MGGSCGREHKDGVLLGEVLQSEKARTSVVCASRKSLFQTALLRFCATALLQGDRPRGLIGQPK